MSVPGSARQEVSRLPWCSLEAPPTPGGDGPRRPRPSHSGCPSRSSRPSCPSCPSRTSLLAASCLVLGALCLITAPAAAAPAATTPPTKGTCIDSSVCSSATTADSPRQLLLLPTPARRSVDAAGQASWTIPVLGWVYAPISTTRSECSGTLATLSREALSVLIKPQTAPAPVPGQLGLPPGRLARFFVDNLCNQRIQLRVGDLAGVVSQPQPLQPAPDDPFCQSLLLFPDETPAPRLSPVTNPGGLFCGKVTLSDEQVQLLSPQGQPLRLDAELLGPVPPGGRPARDSAEAFVLHDRASEVSVISDIDDTVRISHVTFKPALLQGTFFEPFRPTPGVAQLYSRWQQHSPGLALHFISSSPLPLYKPLRDELMARHPFPLATYHLKWFRIREGATIELLSKSPLLTKRRQIAPLLASYPHRRFALVGDSGERDPEVYTSLLTDKLLTPERLTGIFIRDVTCDAQGVHTRPIATGLAGAVEGAGRQVGRTVKDHLPTGSDRSCRQRRFREVFKAFAAATRPPASAPALPVAPAASDTPSWRKWCVFYGGDDAAAQAAVPVLMTPMLAELSDEDRPAQCWPHSAAEFTAALSD